MADRHGDPSPDHARRRAGSPLVVLGTAGSVEEAERIARALVERRLAACVNLVPSVTSVYRWKGEVQQEPEVLMVIKTTRMRFEEVRDAVAELHSYALPEILALEVAGGDRSYLDWIVSMTAPPQGGRII